MAISRNQLLLGGGIVALLAILYFRAKGKSQSEVTLKDIDDSMPKGDEDIPMPEVEPTTGGVKTIPTNDTPIKVPKTGGVKTIPTNDTPIKVPKTGGVTSPPPPPPKVDECMQRWNRAEKLTFFATEEDRIKRRNAFLAQCRGTVSLPVPIANQPILTVPKIDGSTTVTIPKTKQPLNYFQDSVGTLDTFNVH